MLNDYTYYSSEIFLKELEAFKGTCGVPCIMTCRVPWIMKECGMECNVDYILDEKIVRIHFLVLKNVECLSLHFSRFNTMTYGKCQFVIFGSATNQEAL